MRRSVSIAKAHNYRGSHPAHIALRSDGRAGAQAAHAQTPSPCTNGIVMPDPEDNPGFVADCEALWEIREALDLETIAPRYNWSADRPLRRWFNVSIGPNSTRVYRLGLLGEDIRGEIPPAIGGLAGLLDLEFALNQMSGEVPKEIGNLALLERLSITKTG